MIVHHSVLTLSLPAQADGMLEEGTLRAVPLLTACHRCLSSIHRPLSACLFPVIHPHELCCLSVLSVCLSTSPVPTSGLHFLLLHRHICPHG